MGRSPHKPPRRDRSEGSQVTATELFFDLVYIFAVTQLSRQLLVNPTLQGTWQAGLLWTLVWLLWSYTTWLTNYLEPECLEVRVVLIILMLVSLVMSAALPRAFTGTGLVTAGLIVGVTYAVHQIGRAAFAVVAMRGPALDATQERLRCDFQRIFFWCILSGALGIAGGFAHGGLRGLLWLLSAATEVIGGFLGFPVPRMGRALMPDHTIDGAHFAERWHAFILIALGESIIITGTTISRMAHVSGPAIAAFVVAFAESVAFWWLYFGRSAKAGSAVIAASEDPGALARTAYHRIHWLMVFGIIVTAAGDEKILSLPSSTPSAPYTWMILGGPALFLGGHGAFKYAIWRRFSPGYLAGVATLALLAIAAGVLPDIALTACAAAVIAIVAALERRAVPSYPPPSSQMSGRHG